MARNVEFDEEIAVQKAMVVFQEKGYNGTSMRDLTDAMKINSSSLYNTIGDKHELFLRCVKYYTDARKNDLLRRSASAKSPLAILEEFINDAVKSIISGENSCMAVKAAFEMGTNDQRVKDILKADGDDSYRFICKQLANAIELGEIAGDEEPEILADYFISVWAGWNESFILYKDPIKIKKMAQYFIRQLKK